MNSLYSASLRNQNGFAWVAGVALIGVIALVGIFAQSARAQSEALVAVPECTPNNPQTLVSDADTMVGANPAVVVTPHSAWSAASIPGASWIWDVEKVPADDSGVHAPGIVTFTKSFTITGNPTGAVLKITADNEYTVTVNGHAVGTNDDWQDVETFNIPAGDLLSGPNVLTIEAENYQPEGNGGNPAGVLYELVVNSQTCPEPEDLVTIHTQKIVCDEESDLPNWGAGTSTLNGVTANTATRWLNANPDNGCELAKWEFQWVNNASSSSNPGDNTELAPAPWSEAFSNSVTINAISMSRIWFREVFDTAYIPFTGQNTTENVSAEMYCGPDILNYDNWEYIDKPENGWADDYYCVAFNVPLKRPEPNFCEDNLLVDGGFEDPEVTNGAMWELFPSQLSWIVDWVNASQDTPMFELQEGVNGWLAFEGDQYIELDSDRPDTNANTKVWQDITTDDEKTYELTYQFSPRPGTLSADNTVEVYWNGVLKDTVSGDNGTGNTVWTEETISGLAGVDSLSTLEFRSVGTSNELGGFIDAVCLVEVPEEACRLEVVSLEEDEGVGNGDAVEAWNHPSWATDLNAFADWIWDAEYVNDPEVDEARTFAKSFWVTGPVNDATLTFAADNRYWIEINGDAVDSDTGEYNYGATQTLDVSSFIDANAMNMIVMKIENIGIEGETQEGNPAAGIYQLIINAEEQNICTPVEIPECSDGLDNDNDGYIDFEGQDPGCDSDDDDDEYNEPEGPEYGLYCGDGFVDETWEQCDPGQGSKDSIAIDDAPSCNQYCQFDNQCSDLVVARINTNSLTNTGEEYGADMTGDVWIGGDEEGTHNIPGWAWFPVYMNGSAVTDPIGYDLYEDVPGYAINRDNGQVRVRMHGDHIAESPAQEHVDGMIEIVHAYTNTSVLTDMKSQLAQNKLENPFNGTTGGPGNDELSLVNLGDFWMTVSHDDDGFRAEYEITEDLVCENCEEGPTWAVEVEESTQGTRKNGSAVLPARSNPESTLGEPDGNGNAGIGFFSLGVEGTVTVKFDEYIENVDGEDLSFHEITNGRANYPEENALVEVSQDGLAWFPLGEVSSLVAVDYLDFDSTGLEWIMYVRITDTTDFGPHAADADGYDVDAIDATNGLCEEPEGDGDPDPTSEYVVVTPSDLNLNFSTPTTTDWYFWDDTNDIPSTTELVGEYEFVTGPGAPNLPVGSVQMSVDGTERWNIATFQFEGVDLADIEAMSFDTYQPITNPGFNEAIYLNFDVDFDNTGATGYQGRLVFVPIDQGAVSEGVWENHDASGTSLWRWSAFAGGTFNTNAGAIAGEWPDGSTTEVRTWNDIVASHPNAEISNEGAFGGQLLFRAGEPYPAGFTGAVDNFVIEINDHTTTYDFEPEAEVESCLVSGYKYDEEGNPLAGWTIGLEGYYYPEYSLQEVVIYDEQLIGSDVTDENGYYCIPGKTRGEGSNYSVYEIIQEGWKNIGAEINDTPVFGYFNDGEIASVDVDYIGDGMDVNFINQLIDTPNEPNEPNNNTGRSNSRRSGGSSTGRVLGATTEEGFCPFLKDYLHINMQNNPVEVNKAKAFFNSYLGKALILDGVFDQSLFAAAVEFQNMFSGDVLDTWVEEFTFLDDRATGYIYQTTKWKINSILCPGYEAFPDQLVVANGTTVAY